MFLYWKRCQVIGLKYIYILWGFDCSFVIHKFVFIYFIDLADHHVKFSNDTHLDPDPVHVSEIEGLFEAHVGMLCNHHTYRVDIPVSHSLGISISASHAPHNIHVTIMEVPETKPQGEEGGSKYVSFLKIQIKTVREGDISEKIRIYNDEDVDGGGMEIVVTAKVLKSSQGNPLLKTGIHLLSHEHSEESDFTEWPGFSGSKVEDEDD